MYNMTSRLQTDFSYRPSEEERDGSLYFWKNDWYKTATQKGK